MRICRQSIEKTSVFTSGKLRDAPPVLSFRLAEKKERAAPGVRKKRALPRIIRSCTTPSADWLRLRSRRCPVYRRTKENHPASQRTHVRATAFDSYHVGRGNAQPPSQGDGSGHQLTLFARGVKGILPLVSFFGIKNRFFPHGKKWVLPCAAYLLRTGKAIYSGPL